MYNTVRLELVCVHIFLICSNILITRAGNIQVAVLDAGGYAECPDCVAKIHCSTVGLANLEK